ncbi:hypothetical protein SAMN06265367_106230 [Algoriphagus winogradskyi]|jgi:hypothetical protein|uniref:Uncharacterized protein n=1 Tax=Algoriphagus winogradskyi TaxID=237017 RepID=A0ABY1PAE3_9BACT|nr:hypothetical protein SAMN06265367_106230 [Algoriphagus winogradskyi]
MIIQMDFTLYLWNYPYGKNVKVKEEPLAR